MRVRTVGGDPCKRAPPTQKGPFNAPLAQQRLGGPCDPITQTPSNKKRSRQGGDQPSALEGLPWESLLHRAGEITRAGLREITGRAFWCAAVNTTKGEKQKQQKRIDANTLAASRPRKGPQSRDGGRGAKNQICVNLFLGQHPNFSKIARGLFFVHATFSTPIPREKFMGFGNDDLITKFLDCFFCPYVSKACSITSVWGTPPGRGRRNQFFRAQSFETTELTVWPYCSSGSLFCFLQNGLRVAKQKKSLHQAKALSVYGPILRLRSYPDRIPLSGMQVFGLPCLFLSVLTRHGPRFFHLLRLLWGQQQNLVRQLDWTRG